jgi:hypothetical protein
VKAAAPFTKSLRVKPDSSSAFSSRVIASPHSLANYS